jgi:hypothetical protein
MIARGARTLACNWGSCALAVAATVAAADILAQWFTK